MSIPLNCGHPPTDTNGLGTGYAHNEFDYTLCYSCADKEMSEFVIPNTDRVVLYTTSDMRKVVTWSGGVMGDIVYANHSRRARKVFINVDMKDGSSWYGQGPMESGCYVSLRRHKWS